MYLTKKTVNFLTSNRSIKTVLGGHLELDDQVFTHGDEGHVGLGEGGGIAGLVDTILAVKQSVSEVLQLESSIVVSPARTGELRLVTTTEVHQSPSCRSKDSFLARLVTSSSVLLLHSLLLLLKVGDDVLPHLHNSKGLL